MRVLGCVAGLLGGASWVASPFLSGDNSDYAEYAGIALLSVLWFVTGLLTASGSLVWLRAVVGVGALALAWSLIYAVRAEGDDDWVMIVFGVVGIICGFAVLTLARPAHPHHHGAHAR